MKFSLILSFFVVFWISGCKKDQPDPPKYPAPTPLDIASKIPQGLPPANVTSNNPLTIEGVLLGRMLFYDPILSLDSTVACASCHNQELGFSDQRRLSVGVGGTLGKRQSMSLVNLMWRQSFFWDGRAATLQQQTLMPIQDPLEMHETLPGVVAKLQNHPSYPDKFGRAFGTDKVSEDLISKSLEQFLFTLISANSKFDSVNRRQAFFNPQELNGYNLFISEFRDPSLGIKGGADCFHCHNQPLFTTNLFSNNGLDSIFTDLGRENVTKFIFDRGKFKIPTLRNIAVTAPYMHDGRFNTLDQVLTHYNTGLINSSTADPNLKAINFGGIQLSNSDLEDLKAFLNTLTDYTYLNNPEFKNPFK